MHLWPIFLKLQFLQKFTFGTLCVTHIGCFEITMTSFVGHHDLHSLIYRLLYFYNLFVYPNFSKFHMNLFEFFFVLRVMLHCVVYQHLLNLFTKMPNELRSIRTYVLTFATCVISKFKPL